MTEGMDRLTAALADRYVLERELGAGGMATVYLAQDLRHDRRVAIKVLRPELAAVIGADRFLSEIRTTANLQHPHILPLFDSGEANGFLFYVMPYVPGESLRDRLAREHQLPVADAVRIASEVASALDYAHRQGVIHRDIKPENVMLHDGQALVADFGIALAMANTAGTRMTETGMSLGTPHYMSPEQAMGEREITARSDVYALGAITYEMLCGEPPFTGPTAQSIIARVMTEEPRSLTGQRKSIPEQVEAAVFTALEKLPADRFTTAAEFAAALKGDTVRGHPIGRTSRSPIARPSRPSRKFLVVSALVALAALATGWLLRGTAGPAVESAPIEFAFRLGDGSNERPSIAISPDGRRIVLAMRDGTGVPHLRMRELGSTEVTDIPGSEGAGDPVFSHDGKWLAYERNGSLYKLPTTGGTATMVAEKANAGAAWTVDDASLIYTRSSKGLWMVAANGASDRQLTTIDTARGEFAHWYPQVLPDGRTVIFTNYATPMARARIEAVNLSTGKRTVIVEGAIYGRYTANGYLLYARDEAVFAAPFDPDKVAVTGPAAPVLEDVAWQPQDGVAGYAVAGNGTLVYLKASEWTVDRDVVWADRTGTTSPALPRAGSWAQPRLSPDGRWIAISQAEPKRDLWLYDRNRDVLTQLTHAPGAAFNAVWMPDSRSIIYTFEDPVYDLHRLPIDASTADSAVLETKYDKRAVAISPDGTTLIYAETADHDRLMRLSLMGGTPTPLDERPGAQRFAAFSPDGRWIAYDEANNDELPQVYVRPATGTGGRIQVSADGGNQPRWTRGGRELVFRRGDAMMSAVFDPSDGTVGTPVRLFQLPDAGQLDNRASGFDVTPDGSRFLLVEPRRRPEAQPTHVILNWLDVLRTRMAR